MLDVRSLAVLLCVLVALLPISSAIGEELATSTAVLSDATIQTSALSASPPQGTAPDWYHVSGKVRTYYVNDQRIEFTGAEATFAAEGVFQGGIHHQVDDWKCQVESEFFVNQPYDRNLYRSTTPWRDSFAANFDVEPFVISQLYLAARNEDFYFAFGRFATPFGKYHFTNYLNDFRDSPFIRSEAILFRETGLLAQWDPEGYVFTGAVTNGGPNQDANSSKAMIGRAGIERESFTCGCSVKWQDGIGSEEQKQYNRHAGVDAMYSVGRWQLSGEYIYDEYGFRDTTYDPNEIFWGRSLYHRDINLADQQPAHGSGYYLDLGYMGDVWEFHVNFGEFRPVQLGEPVHDAGSHRWLLKGTYYASNCLEAYTVLMLENSVPWGQEDRIRHGNMILAGVQFTF